MFTVIELPSGLRLLYHAETQEVELQLPTDPPGPGYYFHKLGFWDWQCLVTALTTKNPLAAGEPIWEGPGLTVNWHVDGTYAFGNGSSSVIVKADQLQAVLVAWERYLQTGRSEQLRAHNALLEAIEKRQSGVEEELAELAELVTDLGPGGPLVVVEGSGGANNVKADMMVEFLELFRSFGEKAFGSDVTPSPVPHPDHLSAQELQEWVTWVQVDSIVPTIQKILQEDGLELTAWARNQLERLDLGFTPFRFPSWEALAEAMARGHGGKLFWVTQGAMSGGHPWGQGGVEWEELPQIQVEEDSPDSSPTPED